MDVVHKLNELLMLDNDAVRAYSSAIDRITIPYVKERLTEFRADHQRHIRDLNDCIRRLGGEAKDRPDFKGPFIQAMTALRSMAGNEQAIKAMKGNEELTNKKYSEALEARLPADVEEIVRRNYQDEVRHLAFLNEVIDRRIWESSETSAHP
jgi:uncharacterized protein (TIGR02284 family)